MRARSIRCLLLMLLSIGLFNNCTSVATNASSSLELTECQLSIPGLTTTVNAQCGTLIVPENRADPEGRQIELYIAVVPAVSRTPQPDPLFILVGGPGQAAAEVYPAIATNFLKINQQRDIVLIDQRGTGKSNPLTCELPEDDTLDTATAIAALQNCPATLNADPRFYTTEIAMRDLDAVREALGYATINLYGVSYGTRAALTYLRLFPERVRSIVLDAAVSTDYRLFLNTAQDADRALDLLFTRCEHDPDCNQAFPAIRNEFATLLARLEAEPLTTTLPDPVSSETVTVTVDHEMLYNLVFPLLYTPEIAALVPLSLQQAATGNFAPLLAQAGSADAGLYLGMLYAVACTEDAPFIDATYATTLAEGTYFGDRTTMLREICSTWPQGTLSTDFDAPLQSNTPVLLLSGEADPITPPQYATRIAETLPNALHLIGPGMGHGLMGRGCINNLIADFITAGTTEALETTCAQQLSPPPFFLSPTGPRP